MALNTKIYDTLKGSSAITAHTGARIYPVMMPQGVAAFPALLYTKVSSDGIYTLAGFSGTERARYAVDVIAADFDTARTLAGAAHTAMVASTSFACIRLTEGEAYDPEMELHLINQIYSIIGG